MSDQEPLAATTPTVDAIHELLAHRRRRSVLAILDEHGSLALADLADEVASREQGTRITNISKETVLRVYTSLWHAHIPKLADFNVVEYDQELDMVRLAENADRVMDGLSRASHGPDEIP